MEYNTDHPDFGGGGHLAMRLKHPAMVREELLEAQAHGEDEQEPQHGAKEHCRHQHLTLGAHGLTGNGGQRQLHGQRGEREKNKSVKQIKL